MKTDQELLIELAKLDDVETKEVWMEERFRNYLTSYDAILPLVQKQDFEIQAGILLETGIESDKHPHAIGSPREISIALLKAKGIEV